MPLKQYLHSNKDYLPIKEFKIGTFLAEKYLAVKNEKIISILENNREDLIKGKFDEYIENVQKSIEDIVLNVVSMTSGGGTTMESLIEKYKNGELKLIEIVGMIASKSGIGSISKAQKHKIRNTVLDKFFSKDPDTLNDLAELFKTDIIFGNGWLPLIPKEVIEKFRKEGGIILNQHPGPLRKNGLDFGGKGMIGTRVIAARILYLLESGATGDELFTESTVHIMTEKFDEGYSVGVERLDINKEIEKYRKKIKNIDNTKKKKINNNREKNRYKRILLRDLISDIQQKLLTLEHKNVADVVSEIGKTKTIEKHSSYDEILVPEDNVIILEEAKKKAIAMYPNG